jgi:hypothetical protein
MGVAVSALTPILLVTFAAEYQLNYWAPASRLFFSAFFSNLKLIISLILVFCLQNHPLLDDIKGFSGLSEVYSSSYICFAAIDIFSAIFIHRQKSIQKDIRNILVCCSVGIAVFLGGSLLGLSTRALLAAVGGGISLSTFYTNTDDLSNDESDLDFSRIASRNAKRPSLIRCADFILVIVACFAASVSIASFSGRTLWPLSVTFHWQSLDIPIDTFCLVSVLLSVIAIAAPATACRIKAAIDAKSDSNGLLPASRSGLKVDSNVDGMLNNIDLFLKSSLFAVLFIIFSALIMLLELMIREQVRIRL